MGSHRLKLVKVDGKFQWVDPEDAPPSAMRKVSACYRTPQLSHGLSCHPDQVEEFRAKAHPGIDYKNNGDCYVGSRGALREECKARGILNRDAGYGDHAGK